MGLSTEIEQILRKAMTPEHLEVINDSPRHRGHAGDDGSGESHFTVVIVAKAFAGRSRIERHRMVNEALDQALENRPHALSIKASTPEEAAL